MIRNQLALAATVAVLAAGALVSAPTSAGAADAIGIEAASPSVVGGGVAYEFRNKYEETDCDYQYFCTSVWDPTRGQWKVFFFYSCKTYNIANWFGGGYWENNQSGGERGRFFAGANGTGSYNTTARPHSTGEYGWTPINSIRPCGNG